MYHWAVIVSNKLGEKQFIYVSPWLPCKQVLGEVTRGLRAKGLSYFFIGLIVNYIKRSMQDVTREPVEEFEVFGYQIEVHEKEVVDARVKHHTA